MKFPILFSSIASNFYQDEFWQKVRKESAPGGKFSIDLAVKYGNNRFISRNGEWSLPWEQQLIEKFKMPKFDPSFDKSFAEVTDEKAIEIRNLIREKNQKFALMYSGGIDSTAILVSLLKNLSESDLKNIAICANKHSVIENPNMWTNHIWNKFEILDSSKHKLDTLVHLGYRPITADEGDNLFGTVFGLALYQHYDYYVSKLSTESQIRLNNLKSKIDEVHYSNFKDIILLHFSIPPQKKYMEDIVKIETDPNFAEQWYNKSVKNIESSSVKIHTLHDFFWWQLFNLKYVNCASRCSIYLNDTINVQEMLYKHLVNWFTDVNYQQWSMNNNNNGQKIDKIDISTYKFAAKKYIYEFDNNIWYYNFKLKIPSLGTQVTYNQDVQNLNVSNRPNARFGLDNDYNILSIDNKEVQDFIFEHMSKYQIDW